MVARAKGDLPGTCTGSRYNLQFRNFLQPGDSASVMKLPMQAVFAIHRGQQQMACSTCFGRAYLCFLCPTRLTVSGRQIVYGWKAVLLRLVSWSNTYASAALQSHPVDPRHLGIHSTGHQATDRQDIHTCPRMAEMAATSMGSPSGVPLACICKALMAAGATRPWRSAATIRVCCEGP